MRKLVLSISLMLSVSLSFGQDNISNLPDIIPPAPEAMKMIEYGSVPISYATGVPNISVPLYSFNAGGINLPISLSYHAGGVKVNDSDGLTGLKWSLTNGSGSIDRIVNGRPDEDTANSISGWFNSSQNLNFENLQLTDTQKSLIKNGCVDGRPDEFNFSLPSGQSAKFVFNENKQPVLIPNTENFKIDFYNDYTLQSGFKITDTSGIQYVFNTIETNTNTVGGGGFGVNPCLTASYISSWKLDSVILPNNKGVINYHYEMGYIYQESYVGSQWIYLAVGYKDYPANLQSSSISNAYVKRDLKKITFNSSSVEFFYANKDTSNSNLGKKLTKIKVSNPSEKIEEFVFNYSLTGKKRLFLDNITKVSKLGVLEKWYEFEYYNKEEFPAKGNFSQDHFGYYNGYANSQLIPSGNYLMPINSCATSSIRSCLKVVNYAGANRDINTGKINTGNIKKIIYPTKGYTEFTFEPNEAYYDTYEKKWVDLDFTVLENASPLGNQTHYTNTFTLNNEPYVIENIILNNFDGPLPSRWIKPLVELIDTDGVVYYTKTLDRLGDNLDESVSFLNNLQLPNKTYRFRISLYNYSNTTWGVVIRSNKEQNTYVKHKYFGGVRIASTKSYSESGLLPITKEYSYQKFDDPTTSSGDIIGNYHEFNYTDEVKYEYVPPSGGPYTDGTNVTYNYNKLSSSAQNTLALSKNSHVLYTNVKEIFKNGANSYHIKRYFKNYGVNLIGGSFKGHAYGPSVIVPNSIEDYSNGILWKEEGYDKSNNRVSETVYDYIFLNSDKSVSGFAANCSTQGGVGSIFCSVQEYQLFSRWFVDNKTTNTIINTNGNIISTTEKFYYNVSHKLPTRQFVTNSKGETIITTTKYAHELNNSRLISENRIAEPLQVEVSKKVGSTTTKLSTQNTTYKDYGNGIYKPHIVKASKGTAALEDRVIYHTYTGKGNPKEISKKNDAKIYYVWGYEGSMPIAEIKGYTSINSTQLAAINDAISASNSDVSSSTEDQLRTKLTALRNAFASTTAQVTTYTYDRLLGLTSVTDARGYTMFYVYDDFNRLKQVKDKDGNILEENQYRYKN